MFGNKKLLLFSAAGLVIFLLDRLLKYLITEKFSHTEIFLIPKFLGFTLHENTGIAFGIHLGAGTTLAATALIFALLILACVYSLVSKKSYFYPVFLALLGGASNFMDRISTGRVIDYLYLWPYSFFNLSDLLIIAAGLLIMRIFWQNKSLRTGK
ncbi:signal peptidase II [Patescibacteria group bacterium]|nr:signal peptidase II [Patescibacteria group bacterium]MBU1922103.1 signal peptidase II [Patescibacteria group bacterium]